MKALIQKEFGLTCEPITYIFLLTGLMALIPNYPILVAQMILSISLIVSFQNAREAHDILYLATLPIRKSDTVKSKFLFVMSIQGIQLLIMLVIVIARRLWMVDAGPYVHNALMNANLAFIGYVLICDALFNFGFLATFFKTGYRFLRPSICYFASFTVAVGLFETLHFLPGCAALNATTFESVQVLVLILGIVIYAAATLAAFAIAVKRFDKVDL